AIPFGFIGVIFGHLIMGIDITSPSILGGAAIAGVVVNDSILLVSFLKMRIGEGLTVDQAAATAGRDRFRAVLLTSLTTIAGMAPLLFETSQQAQILIPMVTSMVFGIMFSTVIILMAIPVVYTILEDFGWKN
ncbi:MAG: efflux RND transporter permease subunit, partial [Proteobacteria bacterium]|nr:efflux RND transporter permease subunit [Pseudomonadota bacterium]